MDDECTLVDISSFRRNLSSPSSWRHVVHTKVSETVVWVHHCQTELPPYHRYCCFFVLVLPVYCCTSYIPVIVHVRVLVCCSASALFLFVCLSTTKHRTPLNTSATPTVRQISSACVLATVYGIFFFIIILTVCNPSGGRREPDFRISAQSVIPACN